MDKMYRVPFFDDTFFFFFVKLLWNKRNKRLRAERMMKCMLDCIKEQFV